VCHTKTDEPIEVPLGGGQTHVDPRNHGEVKFLSAEFADRSIALSILTVKYRVLLTSLISALRNLRTLAPAGKYD